MFLIKLKNYLYPFPLSIVWTLIVLSLSFYPKVENLPSVQIWQFDKLVHFTFYFFYALFFTIEYRSQMLKNKETKYLKISKRSLFTTAYGVPFLIGFVVELVQGILIPGRMFDILDILANGMGAFTAGIVLYLLFSKISNR